MRSIVVFRVTMLTRVTLRMAMNSAPSTVISMRLPVASGDRLKRMANRYGWTPSDASARLVEEGLRRSEFAFIDFRDSAAGRQACIQGSSLAVWEVVFLLQSYKDDLAAVAKHLEWAKAKVQAAVNYAEAYPDEINRALEENRAMDFTALKRMLPQIAEFTVTKS
jgi:uncharacterized protein (DUF433 family)